MSGKNSISELIQQLNLHYTTLERCVSPEGPEAVASVDGLYGLTPVLLARVWSTGEETSSLAGFWDTQSAPGTTSTAGPRPKHETQNSVF